jgi:hypothetical protein
MAFNNGFTMSEVVRRFVFKAYGVPYAESGPLPMGLPASLGRKDLGTVWGNQGEQYGASCKADGERFLCGAMQHPIRGGGTEQLTFRVDRNGKGISLRWPMLPLAFQGTLVDGELVMSDQGPILWLFDCVALCGKDVSRAPYHHRLAALVHFLHHIVQAEKSFPWPVAAPSAVPLGPQAQMFVQVPGYTLAVKPLWYHTDLSSMQRWTQQMKHMLPTDNGRGVVWTPIQQPVPIFRAPNMFKWKPVHTMDFLVQQVPNSHELMDLMVCESKNDVGRFARVPFSTHTPDMQVLPNRIYECQWDRTQKTWVLMTLREDKMKPNARHTSELTCQHIAENVTWAELIPNVPLQTKGLS